jgi:hypothetical protein
MVTSDQIQEPAALPPGKECRPGQRGEKKGPGKGRESEPAASHYIHWATSKDKS